jgi:hypothetical protein
MIRTLVMTAALGLASVQATSAAAQTTTPAVPSASPPTAVGSPPIGPALSTPPGLTPLVPPLNPGPTGPALSTPPGMGGVVPPFGSGPTGPALSTPQATGGLTTFGAGPEEQVAPVTSPGVLRRTPSAAGTEQGPIVPKIVHAPGSQPSAKKAQRHTKKQR